MDKAYKIGLAALPILLYILVIGSKYLRSKMANAEDTKAKNLFDRILNIIDIAVATIEQTFVLPAKSNGEWTPLTDGVTANNKAKEIIDKLLTDKDKTALTALCGDYGVFVDSAIEKACLLIKK